MTRSSVVARSRLVGVALAGALAAALLTGVVWQIANPKAGVKQASAATGVRIQMTVTGLKQGAFKGDDAAARTPGIITVTAYQFEEVATTTPEGSGPSIVKPVVVAHEMGGSSPQFLLALGTHENLSVIINFFRTDRTGKEINYYRVTLTDARVTDVKQCTSDVDVLEDDSLSFRKMEQQDLVAHTTFILELGVL